MARTLGPDAYNLRRKLLTYGSFLSHKVAFEAEHLKGYRILYILQSSNVSTSRLLGRPVTLCS